MFELPLFPLHSVLFPDMPLHLHIFEERYRQMVSHCLEKDSPFGVVLIRKGSEVSVNDIELTATGCTARINGLERLKNGDLNLIARGEQRFRILKTNHTQAYLGALVESITLDWEDNATSAHRFTLFRQQVKRYLKTLSTIDPAQTNLSQLELPEDPLVLMHLSASIAQISLLEKQALLEAKTSAELLEVLQHIFRRENAILTALYRRGKEDSKLNTQEN